MEEVNTEVNTEVKEVKPEPVKLVNIPVTDENSAFNLIISFVHLAHKRGVFNLDESAKIWECIKMFQKPN